MNLLRRLLERDPLGHDPVSSIIEILILTIGIYGVLRFLRTTRGFGLLRGLGILLGTALAAFLILNSTVGVPVLAKILSDIAPWTVLVVVILFQQELRQGLARFGQAGPLRFFSRQEGTADTIGKVVAAAQRLAKERVGALIAFERSVSLSAYREKGVELDAPVSSILLETIFYPGGPLHDGAVILRGDRILAAACLFPLTENPEVQRRLGTRHRAALGLTEETDAVTLVVSEETGQVSLCAAGRLYRQIPLDQIEERLVELLGATPQERSTEEDASSQSTIIDSSEAPGREAQA